MGQTTVAWLVVWSVGLTAEMSADWWVCLSDDLMVVLMVCDSAVQLEPAMVYELDAMKAICLAL